MSQNTRDLRLSGDMSLTRSGGRGSRRQLLETGTRLREGRYIIEEVLGSGGEGVVYRALDSVRRSQVALKVLHLDDSTAIPQLKREFRFLRDLIHPGLVPLHELVVQRELPFFTMSFIEGANFLEAAADVDMTHGLAIQLAEVLDFLHRTGRVHRDVKPSNLMVRPTGQLVLLDFGIGLDLSERKRGPALVGTPRYMAPEVLRMDGATPKSDAYSFGVLLYEALVGKHPTASGRTDLAQSEPYDPGLVKTDLPAGLREAVCRLTLPDPGARATMAEALALLGNGNEESPSGVFGKESPIPDSTLRAYMGRDAELLRLEEARTRAATKHEPVLVRLEAPSGLGKSATLSRFLDTTKGALLLRSRCSEHELVPHKAFDGVLECLTDYLLDQPLEVVDRLVPPSDATTLVQLFPELARVPAFVELLADDTPTGDYRAMRLHAYSKLAEVLYRLAHETELIIAIDDLQWGDVDSGKLLYEVFTCTPPPPCLVVLAYRSEERETSPCLTQIFQRTRPLQEVLVSSHISLEALGDHDARRLVNGLVSHRGDSQAWVDEIVHEAGGSPLLLTEIASHLSGELERNQSPDVAVNLDQIVEARAARLSPQADRIFGLLCCSGAPLELAFLAEITTTNADDMAMQLQSQRLARQREGGALLEVFHDAIRESKLRALGPAQKNLHLELAEQLESHGGDPAEIARHYHEAGDERASNWAARAAHAANKSFALAQAVQLYRLALEANYLEAGRRNQLREALANALADSGRGAEAAPLYAALAEHAEVDKAIELRRRAAEQWLITGNAHEGTDILIGVHKEVGLKWPSTPFAALRDLLYHRFRLRFEDKDEAPALELKPAQAKKLEHKIAAARAAWPISFISTIHGAANSSLYVRLALKGGKQQDLALGYAMEAIYHAAAGTQQRGLSEACLERSHKLMPPDSKGYNPAFLHFARAQCDYMCGDLLRSLNSYEAAEQGFVENCRNVSWELNSGRILWTDALFYLGRHRELDIRFPQWIADAHERGDVYLESALTLSNTPRTTLRTGSLEASEEEIERGMAMWKSPYVGYHHFSAAAVRAYVYVYVGQPKRAIECLNAVKGDMRRTFMDQVQVARIQMTHFEALACLEHAADLKPGSERRRMLRRAKNIAGKMYRENADWATAFGLQYDAVANLLHKPTEGGVELLKQAGGMFRALRMDLHAASVDARVGELIGGDEGKELLNGSHAVFEQADVCDWVAAVCCHTPRVLPR